MARFHGERAARVRAIAASDGVPTAVNARGIAVLQGPTPFMGYVGFPARRHAAVSFGAAGDAGAPPSAGDGPGCTVW